MALKIKSLFGQNDPVPKDDKFKDWKLYCSNFKLILRHSDIILNNRSYFYCKAGPLNLNLVLLGSWQLPLGILVELWKEKKLLETCPDCMRRSVHIHGMGGSPFSGRNKVGGICSICYNNISITSKKFGQHVKFVMEKLDKYAAPGTIVIVPVSSGLSEIIRKQPSKKNEEIIEAVDMETLIRKLKYNRGS